LLNNDCLSGCWNASNRIVSGSYSTPITKEVTHLKASVAASATSCPAPCGRETYESWVTVGAPYPNGWIRLDVAKWQRNLSTGRVDYDLTMKFVGAGQDNGPCQNISCYYRIEAWHQDGSTDVLRAALLSSDCLSGCWSGTRQVIADAASLPDVTHLRAHVYPSSSSCPDPCLREKYDTGFIRVSNYVYKNHDIAESTGTLEPWLVGNPGFFCEVFLARAGTHYERSTLTDQYLACEAAVAALGGYTIYSVAKAIVDAGGGASLDAVVDDLDNPFPQPSPTIPVPPLEWEDETGCVQNIPEWSVEVAAIHIEEEHGYGSESGKSKWDYGVPWRELVFPFAMNYKAREGSEPGRCERVIHYSSIVGSERIWALGTPPTYYPTSTYTVVTNKGTGTLVTAHPGLPGEDQ
jgi:hypothetical protein